MHFYDLVFFLRFIKFGQVFVRSIHRGPSHTQPSFYSL